MNDKVIAYEPFLFKEINTTKEKSDEYDRIINLDHYHRIERNKTNVSAVIYFPDGIKRTTVAKCNNEDGARWVMKCILLRQTTTEEQVRSVEKDGYEDTPSFF